MLYIVATPLGNLGDLSLRGAKTLMSSDIILAEDTRTARILLTKIPVLFPNLPNPPNLPNFISYYREKEFEKLPEIINWLKNAKNISLISESGMPLISDPGYLLVKTCIKQNIPYTVIPGPSAVTTALLYSGFNPENFIFMGYLPKTEAKLFRYINILKQVKKILPTAVFIFFESPKRINQTLKIFSKIIPHAQVVICREMTKKFEEIIRGKPADLLNRRYKGELTIVVSPPDLP